MQDAAGGGFGSVSLCGLHPSDPSAVQWGLSSKSTQYAWQQLLVCLLCPRGLPAAGRNPLCWLRPYMQEMD